MAICTPIRGHHTLSALLYTDWSAGRRTCTFEQQSSCIIIIAAACEQRVSTTKVRRAMSSHTRHSAILSLHPFPFLSSPLPPPSPSPPPPPSPPLPLLSVIPLKSLPYLSF